MLPSDTRPIRVLIADDHVMVREGLRSMLPRGEFKVVGEASDGQEAADRAIRDRPDVMILDVSMPGADGLVALRRVSRGQWDMDPEMVRGAGGWWPDPDGPEGIGSIYIVRPMRQARRAGRLRPNDRFEPRRW